MTISNTLFAGLAFTLALGCSAAESAVDLESTDDPAQLEEAAVLEETPELGTLEQAVTDTVIISCPRVTKATWIQALIGTVDLLVGQTIASTLPSSTTTLQCAYTTVSPQILDHSVQFEPGTVASACTAKATFSGEGIQIGGVPPFDGWKLTSRRTSATATYNERTGLCRLQLPVLPTTLERKVTRPCTPLQSGYRCPAFTSPL